MRDASAFLGTWPFAGVPGFTHDGLIAEDQAVGIDGAALSPVEAVLQPEPMAANRRLLAVLAERTPTAFTALAVPVINPSLAGWESHFQECRQRGGTLLRAIKLAPNYHDYALDAPFVDDLAGACLAQNLTICLQVRMEDERMHHPAMRVAPVAPAAVTALASRHPLLRILVCGSYMAELTAYRDAPTIQAELSFVESGMTLRDALQRLGPERLLIGTHAPIHMIAANAAKLDADEIDPVARAQIAQQNFDRVFSVRSYAAGSAVISSSPA